MNFFQRNKTFFLPIKNFINQKTGWDVIKFPTKEFDKKVKIMATLNIEVVLDVGANIGQFGSMLRSSGYPNQIISFEPVSSSYDSLENISKSDDLWTCFNFGLGAENQEMDIFITQNKVSSSLLEPEQNLRTIEESTEVVESEKILVKTLDSIFQEMNLQGKNIFLKMDVQGYEQNVLMGASQSLSQISALQMEMPLIKTYKGSHNFYELDAFVRDKNFELIGLDDGFYDPKTGYLLEVDGIYQNASLVL